jgi:hypothetical protein
LRVLAMGALGVVLALATTRAARAVEISTVASREHAAFEIAASRLAVGRDGRVYLSSEAHVLRVERDGSRRQGSPVTYATTMVAANAEGVIAVAHAHFNHSVSILGPRFDERAVSKDFLASDAVGWGSPSDVEAGASDFYALDTYRSRVTRLHANGAVVATYALDALKEDLKQRNVFFRVSERRQRFYVLCPSGNVRIVTFAGALVASIPVHVGGDRSNGWRGGFDVDDDGNLLVLEDRSDEVQTYDATGRARAKIRLHRDDPKGRVSDVRVYAGDIVLKRPDPTEIFQVYDRATGRLVRAVHADAQKLTLVMGSDVWTAGEPEPLAVRVENAGALPPPTLRAWLGRLGAPAVEELAIVDGRVAPPADVGGLYHLRVSTDVRGHPSDYLVDTVVEIRKKGARGTASIFTPNNRIYYGRGEPIPLRVVTRAPAGVPLPPEITLRLCAADGHVVAEGRVRPGAVGSSAEAGALRVHPLVTAALVPGAYLVTADVPGLTVAPQPIVIGPGLQRPPVFSVVQHGDYAPQFPTGTVFDAPEKVAAHLARARALGVNMFVDRLGFGPSGDAVGHTLTVDALATRLLHDDAAVAPEKAVLETAFAGSVAGDGAYGIELRAILLGMDAGLPVGTGFDKRTPQQLASAITRVTTSLSGYPAFRGWSWAANWWVGKLGADAAEGPEERAAYDKALRAAEATGAWDPVLEKVTDRELHPAIEAERSFDAVLQELAPGKRSAMTGPYRAVGVVPPLTFAHADEVDLHYQSEQIQPPQVTASNVDFYKRPGKRAWGHPELWNDDGTGGMAYPTLLQMVMRGADGTGWSGDPTAYVHPTNDPRDTASGTLSVRRSLGALLGEYGPWLTTLSAHDRVAIVVSTRMLRLDRWDKFAGKYFERLYEAYNACLYAHRPASFVFTEDATPAALSRFEAVLVVGQEVELDPPLAAALDAALRGGVRVLHDGGCRASIVHAFAPLGVTFDRIEHDIGPHQDDSAYLRLAGYFKADAAILSRVLGASVPPVADVDDPEVLLTERRSGSGRFVWVVNDTMLDLDPGLAWRVGLILSQRLPQIATVGLRADASAVYDVLGARRVQLHDGSVEADLRHVPARLYAILPRAIDHVDVEAPARVEGGGDVVWSAAVADDAGRPLDASVPVRVRMLTAGGVVLRDEPTATPAGGRVFGRWTVPFDAPAGPLRLEVVERMSGRASSARIDVTLGARVADLSRAPVAQVCGGSAPPLPSPARAVEARTDSASPPIAAAEDAFGVHLKDIALSRDGETALINAMSWDENAYGIDVRSGAVTFRRRVGHHFGYDPVTAGEGFALEGFDLRSAEGYHLYLLDRSGVASRRFALFGLPKRATNWAMGGEHVERIDRFAVAPSSAWVASAGDLGVAVWGKDGKRWWSIDGWRTGRDRSILVAIDDATLGVVQGTRLTAHDARSGAARWDVDVGPGGTVGAVARSADGRTVVLASDASGGRVYVVRAGRIVAVLPTAADELDVSHDGSAIVVTRGDRLAWYADGGLRWTFASDATLRRPRIDAAGARVVVGSDAGTLDVLDARGRVTLERDIGALPVGRWLPDGGLLVASWSGSVARLAPDLRERWRVRLEPGTRDVRASLLAPDDVPVTRMAGWGNAAPRAAPLSPNLLAMAGTRIEVKMNDRAMPLLHPVAALVDGVADPPSTPWLEWNTINYVDSGWAGALQLTVDTKAPIELRGISFFEDPAHPESWLRDMRLEYWDAVAAAWRKGPMLLSSQAAHTHWLPAPVRSARFRFVSTGGGSWPVGNVRLGELVFHGREIGAAGAPGGVR